MDIDDISWAIASADYRQSKLPTDVRQIAGLSTGKLRQFISNVCSVVSPLVYLEIGVWFGATFASAIYQNRGRFIGIDDFSEFEEADKKMFNIGNPIQEKRLCIKSIIEKIGNGNAVFYEEDAFKFDPSRIQEKVTVFFYDGNHDTEFQRRGITHFAPCFADELILLVDDYMANNGGVKEGVQAGIREAGFEIVKEWERFSGEFEDLQEWRNGFYVAMLRRKHG